jgi:hypothetical protein
LKPRTNRFSKFLIFLTLLLLLSGIDLSLVPGVNGQNSNSDLNIWANDGGDKVTQDDLRATNNPASVINSVWDGNHVSIFGAQNEAVSFNLVLEAPKSTISGLNVALTMLNGPNGNSISTRSATGNDVFNFVGRNIELFYVRYLKIEGLSGLAYQRYYYDERHIPERFRLPYDPNTFLASEGTWTDRPDHDKYYPEIVVPLELNSPFTISARTSQCIWGDIYIPKTAAPGNYVGTVTVTKDGATYCEIPITLTVRDFALPDVPNAKTMVFVDSETIGDRYLGEMYPDPGTEKYSGLIDLTNLHFQLAHRHKISLIDTPVPIEQMGEAWVSRLNGTLFTTAKGYSGIGEGTGNNVYSIGTYGNWPWEGTGKTEMQNNANAWVDWFSAQHFATSTDYFLYLVDESTDYPQTQQWAQWVSSSSGSGSRLKTFATLSLPEAVANTPSLSIPCSAAEIGFTNVWNNALKELRSKAGTEFFMYNGQRPVCGSFATEDDGVALRALAWGQYKLGIDRWLYWDSTYYNNYQGYTGQTDLFKQAQTFGQRSDTPDPSLGVNGNDYMNGDGVLFYPGTDTRFPQDSYGVMGPFASLRLKEWRRGIQDVDYLTLASKIDPTSTAQIVNQVVPKFMWEYGADSDSNVAANEYLVHSDISWSTNPDVWEDARSQLASIIDGTPYTPRSFAPTASPLVTPTSEFSSPSTDGQDNQGISLQWTAVAVASISVLCVIPAVIVLRRRRLKRAP